MRPVLAAFVLAACAACAAAGEGLAKEPVTLTTSDGVTISGYFVKGTVGKGPAVVLLHMLAGSKDDWAPIIEKYLFPATGFSYLAIDLRGHGESVRQGNKSLRYAAFSAEDFNNMTKDVEAAVKWLKSQPSVDPAEIAIVGASIGANVALNYAASDPDVKCVALLSPGVNYKGVETRKAMKTYGDRPLFLAAAREDEPAGSSTVTLSKSSLAKKKITLIFEGNLHGTRMFGNYALDAPLAEFLKENLK
jgi:pimeloyl-ACP methyl ester carboxylesterase